MPSVPRRVVCRALSFRLLHVILCVAVLLKLRLDLLDIRWHLDRAVQDVP